MTTGGNYFGS